ncbi:hypothetical protein [Pseudomonas sp. GM17]|uniref:hypothetical protein n=1 Tax=Pseudomonas sp. GM17 TaxID=1144323 RepID=UPI00027243FA|nr:hypothetical protein [Pseudomonas sp. GM17]WIE50660.1 hypothetical protein PMI20_003310 [Pseudomonas sp. GM17]
MSSLQGLGTGLSKAALVLTPYEHPAFLCLLPLMVMTITLYSNQLLHLKGIFALAGGAGLMYLLADIVRSQGKEKERTLWQEWGGAPSIQILRHRDDVLDSVSKERYHGILATKIKVTLPTKEEEAADPVSADAVYAAAGNWLREATRDKKKFDLLFRANVTYGYRRNGFGVRWLGLMICLGGRWLGCSAAGAQLLGATTE